MAEKIAPKSTENLERIKSNISTSYVYFQNNCKLYNTFRRYVFESTIDDNKRSALAVLGKPQIEFNILEAYISRLLGEFMQHEPSIIVTPSEGVPIPYEVIAMIEGYLRHLIFEADKSAFSYEVYKDLLSGGFSVIKVWTEYASAMSMKQVIRLGRVFDPTMCGFDPMACNPSKDDGSYSFELFPMTYHDFKEKYPSVDTDNMKFTRSIDGFSWSYKTNKNDKIVLVCEYYEKKKRRQRIVELADGTVMRLKDYEKSVANWDRVAQPPIIIGEPRWTVLEVICRYTLVENQVIDYAETDYTYLPHVFVDGNSIRLRKGTDGNTYQLTRPYVYHAKGVQDLKNFAGQTLAQNIKNMVQHKFIVKKEALPEEQVYLDALNNIQQASTVVVNAYTDNNPDKPIPEPIREIALVPSPPEVAQAFSVSDPTTQTILGNFASNLGQNDQNLSGKAVIESATVNNSAAMPYLNGYLQGLGHAANIIVDLVPKYIVGKRILPVVNKQGDTEYKRVNEANYPYLIYNEKAIKVNIEAGVSFQTQKSQALSQIIALMGVSQQFAAFMNSESGLPILLQNLTIYGADQLKQVVPKWMQEQQQQAAQQAEQERQAMMQSPQAMAAQAQQMRAQAEAEKAQAQAQSEMAKVEIDKLKLLLDKQKAEFENEIAIAKLGIDQQRVQNETIETQLTADDAEIKAAMTRERAQAEIFSHAIDAASKVASHQHKQSIEVQREDREDAKLLHEIIKGSKKNDDKV